MAAGAEELDGAGLVDWTLYVLKSSGERQSYWTAEMSVLPGGEMAVSGGC